MTELVDVYESIDDSLDNQQYNEAEKLLNYALDECLWDPNLHRKRAKVRLARGDIQNAIADVRAIAKLVPDSTEVYLETSQLYYDVGDVENSLG